MNTIKTKKCHIDNENNENAVNYQVWFCDRLGISVDELKSFLEYSDDTIVEPGRGRKMLPLQERQNIYDFWSLNSELSVKRSNERHIVKIAKSKVLKQIVDLRDTWLERFTSGKGIEKLRGNRKITVKTYRELHKSYCEIYDPVSW